MAKSVQTKYKKFKKEIICEGPAKCKPYPNRIWELRIEELKAVGFEISVHRFSVSRSNRSAILCGSICCTLNSWIQLEVAHQVQD